MNRNQDDELNTGSPEDSPIHVRAEVRNSWLSLALAVGQVNIFPRPADAAELYFHVSTLAYRQLDWLLSVGGFSAGDLLPALRWKILFWDVDAQRLTCNMGWVRWLASGMLLGFALVFVGIAWYLGWVGYLTYKANPITGVCGAFSVLALFVLDWRFVRPNRVALKAACKLRGAGF